jgi:UDP-N-acetylglucosamine 1-carboxyvinyltransferase
MSKYIIKGKNQLAGVLPVSGAKNMATKVLVASLLSSDTTIVTNVPEIEDVKRLIEVLTELGVEINHPSVGRYELKPTNFNPDKLNIELVSKFRASILLLGPLLAHYKKINFPHPGGCTIGKRPIDMFLEGFKAMGVTVEENEHHYEFTHHGLKGANIVFPQVTVTGTETLLLAAVKASGVTQLFNAAQEPEIVALAEFLNAHGAKISGVGTSTMTIEGVDTIRSGEVEIIPDRIEAGSFLALACATNSHLKIERCNPDHLRIPIALLQQMGAELKISDDTIEVFSTGILKSLNFKTHEYPGFPTDMQAPFTVLMTQSQGQSLIHETIFEGRLFYTDFLNRMGANIIMCDPQRVLVTGPTELYGKKLESPDLRAGIAMVIAGLLATGTTEIDNIYQIERGYENLVLKLKNIGALIEKVEE